MAASEGPARRGVEAVRIYVRPTAVRVGGSVEAGTDERADGTRRTGERASKYRSVRAYDDGSDRGPTASGDRSGSGRSRTEDGHRSRDRIGRSYDADSAERGGHRERESVGRIYEGEDRGKR